MKSNGCSRGRFTHSHSHIHISHSELAMDDAMPLIQCAMKKLRSGLYSDCERGGKRSKNGWRREERGNRREGQF